MLYYVRWWSEFIPQRSCWYESRSYYLEFEALFVHSVPELNSENISVDFPQIDNLRLNESIWTPVCDHKRASAGL